MLQREYFSRGLFVVCMYVRMRGCMCASVCSCVCVDVDVDVDVCRPLD